MIPPGFYLAGTVMARLEGFEPSRLILEIKMLPLHQSRSIIISLIVDLAISAV
jgi:hypothetical protein